MAKKSYIQVRVEDDLKERVKAYAIKHGFGSMASLIKYCLAKEMNNNK